MLNVILIYIWEEQNNWAIDCDKSSLLYVSKPVLNRTEMT